MQCFEIFSALSRPQPTDARYTSLNSMYVGQQASKPWPVLLLHTHNRQSISTQCIGQQANKPWPVLLLHTEQVSTQCIGQHYTETSNGQRGGNATTHAHRKRQVSTKCMGSPGLSCFYQWHRDRQWPHAGSQCNYTQTHIEETKKSHLNV